MLGILLLILSVAAFGALGCALVYGANKSEKDRMDKWAEYEHRKKDEP